MKKKFNNKPKTVGEIKGFVKKAGGAILHEWLSGIWRSGYRQGAIDAFKQAAEKDKPIDNQGESDTEETIVDGDIPSD